VAIVEVKELRKTFGRNEAVKGVSFTVEPGTAFGFLGPNGAGKSTTLNMLCGILAPSSGDALIAGHSVGSETAAVKRLLGVVPQDIALYPKLSARVNLDFWGRMYGMGGKELKARIDEILELVGLADRANDAIQHYSGGMKRRVNIAAGLLHHPSVLILDEPTVGVDPQSRNHIFAMVKQLNQEGTTVIYTSHYMEEVEYLCNQVAIMDQGKVVAIGDTQSLVRQAGEHQELQIKASRLTNEAVNRLRSLGDVNRLTVEEDGVRILTSDAEKTLALAFGVFSECGCPVSRIEITKPNLEGLFLKLTGKTLRD
jgi:ABC-2 type transport system ATP-binding protein